MKVETAALLDLHCMCMYTIRTDVSRHMNHASRTCELQSIHSQHGVAMGRAHVRRMLSLYSHADRGAASSTWPYAKLSFSVHLFCTSPFVRDMP